MSSAKPQPHCVTIFPWLRSNLGKRSLGGLTGQDFKALRAAVEIVHLWSYCDAPDEVAEAFGIVVKQMQPTMRRFAFHAIAHVTDWPQRAQLWEAAGLEAIEMPGLCSYERGGLGVDLDQSEQRIAADIAERARLISA